MVVEFMCIGIFAEFKGVLYVYHVRFDPCHPYIRVCTDAVIIVFT